MFCSEVVGMLREKEEMVQQLRDVALQTLDRRFQILRRRRIVEQEPDRDEAECGFSREGGEHGTRGCEGRDDDDEESERVPMFRDTEPSENGCQGTDRPNLPQPGSE